MYNRHIGTRAKLDEVEGVNAAASMAIRSGAWLIMFGAAAMLTLWNSSVSAQPARIAEQIERVVALRSDEANGARLYRAQCAGCHGGTGHGNFHTVTPSLSGQRRTYLIKQLVDLTENFRDLIEMHRMFANPDLHDAQTLSDLAGYMSSLPALSKPQIGNGRRLAVGERIFKAVCAQCHGARGEGAEQAAIPALRGQHYSYLLLQARRISVGHRYSVPDDAMLLLDGLSADDLEAVADYISRLPVDAEHVTAAASAAQAGKVIATRAFE